MAKIELLAPAGNLEKLKYAVMYGADAVFIGGKHFSLRSRASNFTLEEIQEGCEYAHAHGAKVHVTCNIVMHESDLGGVVSYLKALENCGVDAIIASSPTILSLVKQHTRMEAHVSTQQSVINSEGVKFFEEFGVDRVVLGRECSMEDIKNIRAKSKIDIEAFIHGGMCSSVSGRCMLSNVMTNRDANRGGCAQSCRWDYRVFKDGEQISNDKSIFTMSGKDLCTIEYIPQMIDAGVTSLKIEGRMKSLHYIAAVVNAYRKAIDEYYALGSVPNMAQYKEDIFLAENRPASTGFLAGDVTIKEQLFSREYTTPTKDFFGIVQKYNKETKEVVVEVRNYFTPNSEVELFSRFSGRTKIKIGKIYDIRGNELECANKPMTLVKFTTDVVCEQYDIIR
ncbi:MAG: U32 family peptidase [Bacilli bacterium]|nr:U32 family peptidase [Bacilli bacterium]